MWKSPRSIMIILTIILSSLVVSLPQAVHATPALGLDGAYACCGSQQLTTSNPNDVIVVVVECGYISCSDNVSSVTDSSGLDYNLRASFTPSDRLWEYYAIAPNPVSSDNITVLVSGQRFFEFMVFAVKGVNTAAIFDLSPSLPSTIACPGGPGPNDCTVSAMTSATDFVIASTAINDADACKASTGFTQVIPTTGGDLEVDYQIVDTSGSTTYFTCSGTDPTAIVLDALTSSNPHTPIFINGNDGFTADNGVTGGTGTSDDPYVISGWTIQSQNYGIEIANTTAYFRITNVTVSGGGDGIVLSSVQNAVVQNSHISVYRDGIRVSNSQNFQITSDNIYSSNAHGIVVYTSTSFDLSYNTLQGGPFAIGGSYVSDASIVGNMGGVEDGITLDHLSGLLISQNSIRAHEQIYLYSCGDLTIEENNATTADVGIGISNCNNVLVTNNFESNGGGLGIWVIGSDSINITSNTLSQNTNGIRLTSYATGNTITSNLISNNQCGIQTDSSSTVDQNYVANNTFTGNTQDYCSL
jgi:parallel beta-helix repeat protein